MPRCDLIRRPFYIFQKLIVPLKFGSPSSGENKSEGGSLIDAVYAVSSGLKYDVKILMEYFGQILGLVPAPGK